MGKPSKTLIRRVISALAGTRKKVVYLDDLSNLIGVYPDILGQELCYFNPLIRLDPTINIRDMSEDFREYILTPLDPEKKRAKVHRKDGVSSEELKSYSSTLDFVSKKLTNFAGLVDRSLSLSDHDLRLLIKLAERDRKRLKSKAAKAK